ncbi:Mitochondrial carrier [Nesidiocoris tenuis]|nr:Mitochondrial carrier [Nesidiocoris tenuis]
MSHEPTEIVTTWLSDTDRRDILASFWSGAIAGVAVDVGLFPLDTVKTRLQSEHGFWKSGGVKGIYKGVGPTALGAAPAAALFFGSYNTFKAVVEPHVQTLHGEFMVRMTAAAFAETISCVTRVPTEIVKQRRQALMDNKTSLKILTDTLRAEGFFGMYRGFWATVLRDAPFSVIQYPLWEFFKAHFNQQDNPLGGAICGAVAGTIAGGITTPLDVVKTRIMLHKCDPFLAVREDTVRFMAAKIFRDRGVLGFFAGFTPRCIWIFLGGIVYFGVYEKALILYKEVAQRRDES